MSGVKDVDSKLEVESTGPSTTDKAEAKTKEAAHKTKDATVKAGEKTKDAAAKTGEKTKDVAGTTGEAINDTWITTKISADFVNEDTGFVVRSADELTARLDQLAGDPVLRAAIGARGAAAVRAKYTLDRMVAAYDALYGWCRHATEERHNWPARASRA